MSEEDIVGIYDVDLLCVLTLVQRLASPKSLGDGTARSLVSRGCQPRLAKIMAGLIMMHLPA